MSRLPLLLLPLGVLLAGTACADAPPPTCAGAGEPAARGTVATPGLTEASGLAKSRVHDDLLWVHADKGNPAVLHAVGTDGRDRGALSLAGVENTDWEDLALGVDASGAAALYVGDIGDNDGTRSSVRVLRLAEPAPPDAAGEDGAEGDSATTPEVLTLTFPDGPIDAEALAFDPRDNHLLVVTKEKRKARLFTADALASDGSTQVLTEIGELDLSGDAWQGGRKVTAADISPDGRRLLLRTRSHVIVFERGDDQSLAEVLGEEPCLALAPDEPDGEAIAADADGFWTVSEGAAPTLWQAALGGGA